MDHGRPARERADEADHEIDRVIRGQDAQVAHAGPERKNRRERQALLEIILVRQNAALRPPAGPRGIDDAGRILAPARNENGLACIAEFLPALRSREFGARGRFGDQNRARAEFLESCGLRDGRQR